MLIFRAGLTVASLLAMGFGGPGVSEAVAGDAVAPIRLQPHRAIYDVTLDESAPGTSIGSISGRVVYELMGNACEGYAQNMRFVTETTNTEGLASMTDLRTSSWEDAPARRMRFSSSTYANDQLLEQTQGTALKGPARQAVKKSDGPVADAGKPRGAASEGPGGADGLTIEVMKPTRKSARIGEPVFFPIDHSVAMIRQARAGTRVFSANLYDGSEGGEKYYHTTSVIGRPSKPDATRKLAAVASVGKLADVGSWPISIAYFKPETRNVDSVPLYEMYFRFHDNGITSELLIDHGDYRLKGELKELVFLEANPCP